MKRFVFFCIIFGLFTSTYALGVEPAGSGTTEDPWQIDSLANLAWISETPAVWGDHFIQTSDIEAAETRNWNVVDGQPQGFVPIGNFLDGGFSGVYNGRGYKIRDLFINQPKGLEIGFFGSLANARIDSLGLVRAYVRGWAVTGILVGRSYSSKINNSFVAGNVSGGRMIGAFAGKSLYDTLDGTYALVDVNASEGGGYIGVSEQPSVFKRCYFAGSITNSSGGVDAFTHNLFPAWQGVQVEDCFAMGDFNSINDFSAGDTNYYVFIPSYQLANYRPLLSNVENWQTNGLFLGMDTLFNGFSGEFMDSYQNHEYVTPLDEMKIAANFPTYDFAGNDVDGTNEIWAIVEDKSLPYLTGMDAPVFAFADTLDFVPVQGPMTQAIIDVLIENDIDPNDPEATLTARWKEGSRYSGDSVVALYQAGTIKGADTMWAGISTVVFPQSPQEIEISSYEELKQIGWITFPVDGEYRLTGDIDARSSQQENNGMGFRPLARARDPFRGVFHGEGFAIKNLTINAFFDWHLGLFRAVDSAIIDSLVMSNYHARGNYGVGSVAGKATESSLQKIAVSGEILGQQRTGGLVGNSFAAENISIKNSYYSGVVVSAGYDDFNEMGGLLGYEVDTLEDSYSNALFWSDGSISQTVEYPVSNRCFYCENVFWNLDYWPQDIQIDSAVTDYTALRSPKLLSQFSYTGWDFTGNSEDGTQDVWAIIEGRSMPYLVGLDNPPFALPDTMELGAEDLSAMSGELIDSITANDIDPDDPTAQLTIRWTDKSDVFGDTLKLYYQVGSLIAGDTTWGAFSWVVFTGAPYPLVINTYEDLKKIGNPDFPLWTLAASYELGSDIDASESITENGGVGFSPIGSSGSSHGVAFSGVFDGKGYVISNLHSARNSTGQGLFNILENATIKNLGVVNANISGSAGIAILAANISNSKIQSVYVEGEIRGLENGGMLTSVSDHSVYENCYAGGVLDVHQYASGLVNYNNNDSIRNSYSTVHLPHLNDYAGLNLLIGEETGYASDTVDTFLSNTYAYEDKVNYVNRDNAIGYPTFDFENIWAIREDSTMPALRSVNNAPFAFDDVDSVGASLDMRYLLANDFDYEKVQDSLVYKILEPENLALTWNYFIPGDDYAVGDSLLLRYRAGELLASGDTLWGNIANAKLYFKQNTRPIPTTATYETEMNTPLVLPLDSLGYDPDGDARFYAVAYHPYYGEEQFDLDQGVFVYTPDSAFTGSDSLQFSIGDGEYNMTAWMYINVLDTSEVDTTDQTPSIMNVVTNGENVSKIRLENNQLWIQVQQAKIGRTKVEMFSVSGHMIREHDFGIVEAGSHNLYVDMGEIEPSVYYVILYRNGQVSQAKSVIYTGQ